MGAVLLQPGEGETISDRAERNVVIKLAHDLADVTWTRYEPGERGPDPHVHEQHADAWYVLEGEVLLGLGPGGASEVRAPAGTLVLVPARVIHTFRNEAPVTARFLNVHAPSMGFAESLRRRDGDFHWDSFDPPEDGGRPTRDVVVRGPGEGEVVTSRSTVTVKAADTDGDGRLTALDALLPAGYPGPPLHVHRQTLEALYVLEGRVSIRLDEQELAAEAGSFVGLPPGVAHTFSNPHPEPARCVALAAPAGIEGLLRAAADGHDPAELASRYDTYPVEA